jgi:hypothetical protein
MQYERYIKKVCGIQIGYKYLLKMNKYELKLTKLTCVIYRITRHISVHVFLCSIGVVPAPGTKI